MADPPGEHDAVATTLERVGDVFADTSGSVRIVGERGEDRLDVCRFRLGDLGASLVDDEVASQKRCRRRARDRDRVAHGAAVHLDDLLEPLPSVGRGGQTEPPPCRSRAQGAIEGDRRDVVALVDDNEPVAGKQLAVRLVVASGQCLDRGQVDDTAEAVPSSTHLPDLSAVEPEVMT